MGREVGAEVTWKWRSGGGVGRVAGSRWGVRRGGGEGGAGRYAALQVRREGVYEARGEELGWRLG
jgi:hypothetical protein